MVQIPEASRKRFFTALEDQMTIANKAKTGLLGPAMKAYHRGYVDGVEETVNQLEGRSEAAPAGCYHGPMPDELRIWLTSLRKRLDNESA